MVDEAENKPQHSILSLAIKDKGVLSAAYMSFVNNGALFVPSAREHTLGEQVDLLISLMDEKEKLEVKGKVIWITPKGAQGNRAPGIGVQFQGETGRSVRDKMEVYLAGMLNSDKPTHTL